jgi:hypothetical protein
MRSIWCAISSADSGRRAGSRARLAMTISANASSSAVASSRIARGGAPAVTAASSAGAIRLGVRRRAGGQLVERRAERVQIAARGGRPPRQISGAL